MNPRLTLPATRRLKRNNDFLRVRDNGRTYRCAYFALFSTISPHSPSDERHSRIGISASRRVGNAVSRNKLKRRFRELFRILQYEIRPDADIVVSIRPPASQARFQELEQRFKHAIQYNGLLRKPPGEPG